jgi:hypothetical protein
LLNGSGIGGFSGEHPAAHRQALAGDSQRNNGLRTPGVFLGFAKFANTFTELIEVFILKAIEKEAVVVS